VPATKLLILLFYNSNIKNTPIEVPLLALQQRGYDIHLVTQAPRGGLHTYYDEIGLGSSAVNDWVKLPRLPGPLRHLGFAYAFARIAQRLQPFVIFTHIHEANVPTVLAHRMGWLPCPVVTFRHNGNAYHLAEPWMRQRTQLKDDLLNQFLNGNSQFTTAPGLGVLNMLTEQEDLPPERGAVVPYMYHFDQMRRSVSAEQVVEIRRAYPGRMLLMSVMRFVPLKRHYLLVQTMQELLRRGIDCQLVLLDGGPILDDVKRQVAEAGLTEHIHFIGRQPSTLPYLAAADLVLHPSITDASNSVVKEAALVGTPAVAVSGVGDFDDYIRHEENGFLAHPQQFVPTAVAAVEALYTGRLTKQALGQAAGQTVYERFNVSERVTDVYEQLVWTGRRK
jgi:glycosyltransferase involved in cell wall biosynthesis